MHLAEKTILLTGGCGGIGHELVRQLTDKGATVISVDLQKPKDPVSGVTYLHADVTRGESLETALTTIDKEIDILILNAGVMRRGEILSSLEEEFDLLMGVNVKGVWLTLKHVLPRLSKNPIIVPMASRHALYPPQNPALYALTKITVDRMFDFVERSHRAFDIRRLYPGPTNTPVARQDLSEEEIAEKEKIMFEPMDLAARIVALLESNKKKLVFDPKKWEHVLMD